ncbi:MAG: PKD domain-containing protein [Chitinophagaceae bacterium]|nr:PKD domain-containing protein [Chitinophagaceae bacterium]
MTPDPALPYLKSLRKLVLLGACLCVCFTALAQLKASFTSDKPGGCPPFSILFSNNTSGASGNAVYEWDFGNGNSSTLTNPAAVYTGEKEYTVTLTVTDNGKKSVFTQTITGFKKPVADFTVAANKACIPATIQFVSNSSPGDGTIVDYYWDFGDGTTERGYGNTMSHTYITLMKPTVNLTVSNNYGCHTTVEKKEIAEILPSMQSSFTTSRQVLCKVTDAVQFTNTSSGPGTLSYEWNFGDGTTSTVKNPSYSFNKKGVYTVSLTVKNAEGCSVTNTQSDLLNVASYKASFNAPALICKDQQVSFNSTSTPTPNSYAWQVNAGTEQNWWGTFPYYFSDTGKHTVRLINIFGTCADTATATVHVKPTPQPGDFIADLQTFCGAPTTVKFKDTTAGAVQWEWKFNDYYNGPTSALQAPSYTYTSDGWYWVSLAVTNAQGCTNSVSKYINITKPWVNIGNKLPFDEENYYCGYSKVQTYVADASDVIATYKWSFGDGTTSTEAEPVHEFTQPGTYNVFLEYTLQNGCKGTSTSLSFTVYKKPKPDFTVSPGTIICGNTPTTYTYTGGSAFTNLSWVLDGDYTETHNPYIGSKTVQYQAEGVYDVRLTVTNGNCWDTISKPSYVTVKLPFPRINGYDTTCKGTRGLIRFHQNSIGATAIKWDFGDGKSQSFNSNEPDVEHEYNKTGTYKVVLTATNGQCNVRDSVYVNILLKQKPVLTLSPGEICSGMPTTFTASGYETNPASGSNFEGYYIKSWEYDDGTELDGFYTRVINNIYSYWITEGKGTLTSNQPKNNQVRVITTSSWFGCEDTTTFAPITFKGATAAFEVLRDKECFNTGEVTLKDASVATNNSITQWHWDFGDGQTQTLTKGGEVKHKYDEPRSYYVTLTITDAGGCSSVTPAYSKQVFVKGPKVAFAMSHGNNVPLNTTVTFYNNTNSYGCDNVVYEWDFGDGSPISNNFYETHTYPNPGTYTIRLKATDPVTGCTSQTEQTLVVRYFNSAFQFTKSFVTSSQCAPAVVSFQNTSYDYTKIIWDFGDNSMPLQDVNYPSHVYKQAGTYIVVLSVYGYNGLKGEYKDTIVVKEPAASLKVTPADICLGQEAQLKAGGPGITRYTYDFGDGNIGISTDSLLKYSYTTPGIYSPQLLVSDENGCTQAASSGDIIRVRPQPVLTITPGQPRLCQGERVRLTASAAGAVQYTWQPANGIAQLNIANPTVTPIVTTTYQVEAKDDIGCTATGSTTVMVVQPEFLKVRADTGICFGEQVQLNASGTSKYLWINNTAGLSSTTINNPVAKPLSNTVYTITGSDSYGCFPDTAEIEIKVYSLPSVTAPADAEIIAGTALLLSPTGSADVVSWKWTPATYLDCSYCPSPTTKALANTTYTVTVTNANGCTAKDDVFIKMQCDAAKVHIPNVFTPNGDGKNDVFTILGISYVKKLTIFNRYGRKVFERSNFLANDRSTGWDGTLNGMPLQTDSYVYFVEMECDEGGIFTRKGTVTLIR